MAASRMFPGWRVVVGSGFGIAFGSAVFISAAFPQLGSAWSQAFGWNQAEVARAATLYMLLQVVVSPAIGWLLDRFGSRRVACASILLFALTLLGLSTVDRALFPFYGAFVVMGLVTAGTNVVSYARALSLWFDRKRGLALGLAASSQAIGAVAMPLVTARLVAAHGWQSAVVALAVFELVVCLPMVFLLVRDSPAPMGLQPDGDTDRRGATVETIAFGYAPGEILRSVAFWKLAAAFLALGVAFFGLTINIVFVLGKTAGLTPEQVAGIQAAAGAAVLIGRIGFGWLLDRLHAPLVGVMAVAASMGGMLIYANSRDPSMILVGALLIGCSIGGESDLLPYLSSRYFGTRSLSTVFGWFLSIFYIGGAIGPTLFASVATSMQGVVVPLYGLVALQVVPVLLFLSMGRYPTVAQLRAASAGGGGPDPAPLPGAAG